MTSTPERSRRSLADCKKSSCVLLNIRGGSDYHGDAASAFPSRPGDDRYRRSSATTAQEYSSNDYYESQAPPSPYREQWEEDGDQYYEDYERNSYDDRRRPQQRRSEPSSSVVPNILRTGDKRIGLMLLGAGTVVTMLGISLFFNKTLMRLGNLLFIAGVPMTLGPTKVVGYFWQPQKARATACLGFGIFLVFVGWPVFGIVLEVFGLLNLFGNLFPVVLAVAKQMPIVGTILNLGANNNNNNGDRNTKNSRRRERYYEEEEDDYYQDRSEGRRPEEDERYY